MRRNKNINRTSYDAKMMKMDQDVYQMRRKVMDVIYEVKRNGYKIPRVEVRIVEEGQENIMGYAYLNQNIVHIKREWINSESTTDFIGFDTGSTNEDRLTHLVLHEIVHAVTGFHHEDKCYLMNPIVPNNVNVEKSWEAFSKYF